MIKTFPKRPGVACHRILFLLEQPLEVFLVFSDILLFLLVLRLCLVTFLFQVHQWDGSAFFFFVQIGTRGIMG